MTLCSLIGCGHNRQRLAACKSTVSFALPCYHVEQLWSASHRFRAFTVEYTTPGAAVSTAARNQSLRTLLLVGRVAAMCCMGS
eukprot:2509377-Amphidinium_carterae.1